MFNATTTTILKKILDSRMYDAKIISGHICVLISDTLISGTQHVGYEHVWALISDTLDVSTTVTVLSGTGVFGMFMFRK